MSGWIGEGSALAPRLLFLDHRDSFAASLVALLRAAGALVEVIDAPAMGEAEIRRRLADPQLRGLVLSPGPGHPLDYPNSLRSLDLAGRLPIWGVCLGHQLLAVHAGAPVLRVSDRPVHGRLSTPEWQFPSLWLGDPSSLRQVILYNSLGATAESCMGAGLRVLASEDGVCLALEHSVLPRVGVQFHPESFATPGGALLAAAFVRLCSEWEP